MRLIDADKLLTYLKDISIGAIPINGDGSRDEFNTWLKCMEVVKNQPTAYDVDKVVKQLEELANSDVCCNIEGCPYMGNNDINCENCAVFQTIPIVKAGGIDEQMENNR